MNVNGIQTTGYSNYVAETYDRTSKKDTKSSATAGEEKAVVYESSAKKMSEEERAQLVQKLKAETQSRVNQFKSMVEDMFLKQGQKVQNSDDIWSLLASGKLQVDPETAAKAKEEISEDGYWGVKQTSERIFDMAVALSGGDEEKMNKMLDAFKKGYEQATKAWGRELPDISSQTYDAVMEKFENYTA